MEKKPSNEFHVRPGIVDEIIPLRHEVLRAGLPREAAIFDGDELPTTRHWVAVEGPSLTGATADPSSPPPALPPPALPPILGCLTMLRSTLDGEAAWQLRGMAVTPGWQGRGVGRELVLAVYRALQDEGVPRLLWCNAREPAVEFYRKLGWTVFSQRFEIPTAGPHYKMTTRLE